MSNNNIKTNLIEVLKGVDSPALPKPVGSSKANKFKPSGASSSTRKPLPTFSSAGWKDKQQPQPLIYVSDSASSSSIAGSLKRNSSDPSFVPEPSPQPPKRPKRDAFSNKENIIRDTKQDTKGKGRAVPLTSAPTIIDIDDEPPNPAQRERRTPQDSLRYASPAPNRPKKAAATLPSSSTHQSDASLRSPDTVKGWLSHCRALKLGIMDEMVAFLDGKDKTKDYDTLRALNDVLEVRIAELQSLQKSPSIPLNVPSVDVQDTDVAYERREHAIATASRAVPPPQARACHADPPDGSDDEYWDNFDEPDITMADIVQSNVDPEGVVISTKSSQTLTSRSPTPPDNHQLKNSPHYALLTKILKSVFKLDSFRKNQLEAVIANMEGKDVFVLMPTGGGKSLCFQLPAICVSQSRKQITIVLSPLLSLIKDQVTQLQAKGVNAYHWSNETPVTEHTLSSGEIPIIYVTPEKLQENVSTRSVIQRLYNNNIIARFVIDEAHCISTWGQDFRPAYATLGALRTLYPNVPIIALTATANRTTVKDILSQLKLRDPVQLSQSFNRPNLHYTVKEKKRDYKTDMIHIMKTRFPGQSGIVFCRGKQACEELSDKLKTEGIHAAYYHADRTDEEKARVVADWMSGRVSVITATIAFGMGIDKADVRFVIHYNMPKTLSGYYQETGRAGRDGQPSECILYFNYQDLDIIKRMIAEDKGDGVNSTPEAKQRQVEAAQEVYGYCRDQSKCRRVQVLHHFDERFDPKDCNQQCDVCENTQPIEEVDATEIARSIIKLMAAAKQRGIAMAQGLIITGLRGSAAQAIKDKGVDKLEGYGEARNQDGDLLEFVLKELLHRDVLRTRSTQNAASNYHTQHIEYAPGAAEFQRELNRTPFKVQWRPKAGKGKAQGRKAATRANSAVGPAVNPPPAKKKGKGKAAEPFNDPIEDDMFDDDDNVSLMPPSRKKQANAASTTSISAPPISTRTLSRNEYVYLLPSSSLPTKVIPVTREDLPISNVPEDVLHAKLKTLRRQFMKDKNLQNPNDVLNDSVLYELSLMPPADYQSFKQTVADAMRNDLLTESQLAREVDAKWLVFGQQFLNLCVEHKTGRPAGNPTPVAAADLQTAYQYRPNAKASTSGSGLVTTPITFVPGPSISVILPRAGGGGKKFKPS